MKLPAESTTIETSDVDWAFAEMVLRRYAISDVWLRTFLAEMMAKTRQGHTCQEISQDTLNRLPDCLVSRHESADRLLKYTGSKLYFHRYWHLETLLLAPLRQRFNANVVPEKLIIEGLNKQQCQAVAAAQVFSLLVLTGGPGTGKTFTIGKIVESLKEKTIVLAAPTGKAVSKLKDSTLNPKVSCKTLHALLGIKKPQDMLEKQESLPYDVVIVDECSMIDIGMWNVLLGACSPKTVLILVGDSHQLAPVEGGNVFEEIVQVLKEKCSSQLVELTECVRTDCQELKQIALQVLKGSAEGLNLRMMPTVSELVDQLKPVYTQSHSMTHREILAMGAEFQILSALRKGPYGCDALNQTIYQQIKCNQKADARLVVPIIITRNAFDLGLNNGDTGVWIQGDEEIVLMGDKILPKAMVPAFDLAYVLSVHKSQGSEYEHVYLILPPRSEHFGRKVLYTAVTRAKAKLTIAASYDTVQLCIANEAMRTSGLKDRLLCTD